MVDELRKDHDPRPNAEERKWMAVEQPDGKLVIPDKLTQQEIAERVGASRDMVSRIFRDLSQGGYISVENRIITINKKPPARW